MFANKLAIFALLLSSTNVYGKLNGKRLMKRRSGEKDASMSDLDADRYMKSKGKGKSDKDPVVKKLKAVMKPLGDEHYQDLGGRTIVKFEDGDMVAAHYHLEGMPEACKDTECWMTIHSGDDCGDIGKEYAKKVWDDDADEYEESPMGEGKTGFTTSEIGSSAGTLFGIDNNYTFKNNKQKLMVFFGPNPDYDEDDRRTARRAKSGKGPKEFIKIACGKLRVVD
jgi:hypothetical protein